MEDATFAQDRPRTPYEELRRTVMRRLRELGFRTTGGVARLEAHGNLGVIEFQKSGRSTPESTLFTIAVGIALGELIPAGAKKPLAHLSVEECHERTRLGALGNPPSDAWWTLGAGAGENDDTVRAEVLQRVEQDALPYVHRMTAAGALVAAWEADAEAHAPDPRRRELLRRVRAGRG